jgi:FMN phosphatase YigB (HAD superfamily)
MPAAVIDTVIFDVGGVLAETGRHSDFARRFPPEVADQVTRIFVGDYADDGDHPWHRLERGEITLAREPGAEPGRVGSSRHRAAGPTARRRTDDRVPPSAPMMALVQELPRRGFRLGVLTNNVAEFRDNWRR